MTDTTTDVPDEFAGYDDLPAVPLTSADHGPKVPRFDGDVSALPDRACWALQNLLTRRHISGERQPQLWSWVAEFADVLRVRLSELDLRLRIVAVQHPFIQFETAQLEARKVRDGLRQGLRILDTPGLNALGSEPELTLSMLPSAQAIIFLLAFQPIFWGLFEQAGGSLSRSSRGSRSSLPSLRVSSLRGESNCCAPAKKNTNPSTWRIRHSVKHS